MKILTHSVTLFALAAAVSSPAIGGSIVLNTTVRDFKAYGTTGGHIDFENAIGNDPGIVATTLPASKDPTYMGTVGNPTTHGADEFNMWFGGPAVAGIDAGIVIPVALTFNETFAGSGVYNYNSSAFFPIDGAGYGNQGYGHNFHFTLEMHTQFTYQTGQSFSFTGDDDVWVYINNSLVIDLGGVHGAESAGVNLDLLGLTAGNSYDFDFYFAERHTVGSNLNIQTSIKLLENPVPEGGSIFGSLLAAVGGLIGLERTLNRRRRR